MVPDPDATVVRPGARTGTPPADDPDATVVRAPRRAAPDPDATVLRGAPRDDPDATIVKALGPVAPRPAVALPRAAPLALPVGFRLHEYRIDGVLGQGGFGITYLATDIHLHARVAIKEYLPEEIAFRAGDRSVSPNASRHRDRYRQGLESFLVEARTLASFRHPAIVRVARFFEAHRTAYMVLEYEKGSPLKAWWPQHQAIGEKGLVELLAPLLDGLAVVHAAGFLHRDIKPDNIQVRDDDGRLVLLDFGSAGQAVAVADQAAVVVTPGYAPPEQYGAGGQGPWTDVYALGATLYWCVTGRKPPDAEARASDPASWEPAVEAGAGRCGEAFLKAIDWALEMDPQARPRDIVDFRRALFADHLSSLNLQDALKKGDTVVDGEAETTFVARWRTRARQALRTLLRPPDWPLAAKLTLAMLVTALLPMVLTGLYNLRGSLGAVSNGEYRYVEQIAQSTAGRISQFITDFRHLSRIAGTDPAYAAYLAHPDDAARDALRERLTRFVQAHPDVQLVMLMDPAGRVVVSSDADLVGRDFGVRPYVREALKGRSFVTGITIGSVSGVAGMVFSEPVRGSDDAVLGVLALRVRGSSVAAIVDEVRNDAALTPFLIDGDGVIIHHLQEELLYHSLMPLPAPKQAEIRADQRFRRDRIESTNQPELAAAMIGAQAIGHVAYRSHLSGQDEIAGYAPVTAIGWVVGVGEPRADFEAPLGQLYRNLAWSVAIVGLVFTVFALRFARSLVQPIRALTRSADALKAGDFDNATVDVRRRDEVGQLARTFNVMIDVLRQRERERSRERGRGKAS